jgi:hypothetical protein
MPTKKKFSTRAEILHTTDAINEKKRKLQLYVSQCQRQNRSTLYGALQDCDEKTLATLTDVFSTVLKRRIC